LTSGERNFSISVPSALVAELEVVEDLLHVRREAVEVGLEVDAQLLLAGPRAQVTQGEAGGVVEGLAGCLAQRLVLVDDVRLVERGPHLKDGRLGRLEDGVEATQHSHRQDHVAVLAAHVKVAQDIVGDAPDEVGDPVQPWLVQVPTSPSKAPCSVAQS
jgi:hypothetical protein